MKAEERHQTVPTTGDSPVTPGPADSFSAQAKPYFDKYGTKILLALAAVLLVAAVIVVIVRMTGGKETEGWNELSTALIGGRDDISRLAAVAEDHPDSPAAAWARLHQGQAQLRQGAQALFTSRETAVQSLTDAQESFEAVLDRQGLTPDVRVRALMGLARASEMLSDGDLSNAIEYYEQVADEYPDTVYGPIAEQRIAELKEPEAADFYAWFSKQKPQPADRPMPRDMQSNPFGPGFTLPGMTTPGAETPGTATPGSSTPTDGATPETGEAPAAPLEAPRPAAAANGEGNAETSSAEPSPATNGTPAANATPAELAGENATAGESANP